MISEISPYKKFLGVLGGNVNLTCTAVGSPRPSITWIKDNESIVDSFDIQEEYNITSHVIITYLLQNHSGEYTCNATNNLQSVIETVKIDILGMSFLCNIINVTFN